MTRLEKFWVKFMKLNYAEKVMFYVQHRKFFQHLEWRIPWPTWETGISFKYEDLHYSPAKASHLRRTYLNPEEVEKANKIFVSRVTARGSKSSQSSVACRMGAAKKDGRSQGYCMSTIVLSYQGHQTSKGPKDGYYFSIDVYYRTTELTQKFLADLMFLHREVFPALLKDVPFKPTEVNFHFSQAYISGLLGVIGFQWIGAAEVFRILEENDIVYYRVLGRMLDKWLDPGKKYNYKAHHNMYRMFRDRIMPQLSVRDLNYLKGVARVCMK